jgi:hypothetical protein
MHADIVLPILPLAGQPKFGQRGSVSHLLLSFATIREPQDPYIPLSMLDCNPTGRQNDAKNAYNIV